MKPGPATSTLATASLAGMWATMAPAILAGAQWARRAERMATVEDQSPLAESAGRSKPNSVTSKAGSSPASWAD